MATVLASNRQLKVLRLFAVSVGERIPAGQAGVLVHNIFEDPAKRERWNKYVYLTHDVDSKSGHLKLFDTTALENVVLPPGWSAAKAEREYREQVATKILSDGALYDTPPPAVIFLDRVFVFTGRFQFGTRERCEQAVLDHGGWIPESNEVTHAVDYLVVGTRGSERWKHRGWGSKIESAIVERSVHGRPAIVTEEHWHSFLADAVIVRPSISR